MSVPERSDETVVRTIQPKHCLVVRCEPHAWLALHPSDTRLLV